jgi:hypothetical protein
VHRMAGSLGLAALLALALAPVPAQAQVFGQFSGGSLLPMGKNAIGGYVELSDNLIGVLGQVRSSFQEKTDFGFQGGVGIYDRSGNNVTAVRLGADFRMLARPRDERVKVDLVFGAGIGVETGDDLNILRLGPSLIAGMPAGGTPDAPRFRPFGGIEMLFNREQVGDENRSGLTMPVHLGTEWMVAPGVKLYGELQWRVGNEFGDQTAISTGISSTF